MFGVDDAIIAAGISAAASIAGGVMANQASAGNAAAGNFASFQIADANRRDAQYQFAQNQNAQQRYFDSSQDFTREMWNLSRNNAEYMSNTAYQRAMFDMRSAGLNPLLAYQQGGASAQSPSPGAGPTGGATPSTSSGSSYQHQMPQVQNVLGPATSSAVQAAQVVQNIRQGTATIEQTQALTGQAHAQTAQSQSQARLNDTQTALSAAQTMTEAERTRFVAAQEALERERTRTQEQLTAQGRQLTQHQENYGARPNPVGDAVAGGVAMGGAVGNSARRAADNTTLPRIEFPGLRAPDHEGVARANQFWSNIWQRLRGAN